MAPKYKTILITGASSGIGAAVATEFAEPGVILGLIARRKEKLDELKARIEQTGAQALTYSADVGDYDQIKTAVETFAADAGGLDLAIANAGIGWDPGKRKADEIARMAKMIDTNVRGVVLTLAFALDIMEKQGHGHIAATSSVAGFRGLPVGPYSATKAFVRTMLDSWRMMVEGKNIDVTTIAPGFVETAIIEGNQFSMPFLISAEEAAKQIRKAIEAKKRTAIFPWQWHFVLPFMKSMPDSLIRPFAPKAR